MNPKRQLMEASLAEASPNLCKYLWDHLIQAGVPLAQHDIVLVSRLVCEYIKNTNEGKGTALKLLGATCVPGRPEHAYYPDGYMGDDSRRIPSDALVQYRGWLYTQGGAAGPRTYALPFNAVQVQTGGGLEVCDETGIRGPRDYCVRTVSVIGRNGREETQSLSNYARLHSESRVVRETADPARCKNCRMSNCAYHPNKLTTPPEGQLVLIPGGGGLPA